MGRMAMLVMLAACGGGGARVESPKLPPGTQRIAVGGHEVVVDIRGNGPVCIAHPGGPGLDSTYLHDKAFEARFTMIYIDPLGTGASAKLPAGELYSLDRDVSAIEAVRAKLELDRVCLVGHSYGGFVVQTYATKHPQHVSGLLLYSTTPTTEPEWEKHVEANMQWYKAEPWFEDAVSAFAEEPKAKDEAELQAILLRAWPMYFADWTGHRSEYTALINKIKLDFDVYRRRPEGKNNRFDVRRKLGLLPRDLPVAIVTGDKDFSGGVTPSTWISTLIPKSKLIVIDRAGHFAHVEQPGAFADAVGKFAAMLR